MSLDSSETPKKPDCLFRMVFISSGVRFSCFMMYSTALASMAPLRVPMIKPSRGVKPMEVSKHLPPCTAVMEEPCPDGR